MNKMKKMDLVKLNNSIPYTKYNLTDDMHGIVVNTNYDNIDVLFFNPNNVGDYAVVRIKISDLILEKEKLPPELENELLSKLDIIISKSKNEIEPTTIKEYDVVELIVEDEKYSKYGIHKGDKGCVMDNNAIQDYIEVDFSGINKNGDFYGDCISVKIKDLKVIK